MSNEFETRWRFKMEDMKLVAEPDMEKLNDFVRSSVDNMCNILMLEEERLLLDAMPFGHLVLLQCKINEAIERKKQKMLSPEPEPSPADKDEKCHK